MFCCLQSIARSQYNAQFPHYCKVGRISVIGLDIGGGLFRLSNSQFMSFTGNVLRTSDVTFMTEQDGYGSITAKFNGAVLQCSGYPGMKRKTCVIPRAMRPWNGRITVTVFSTGGHNPSTSYSMIGTPGTVVDMRSSSVHRNPITRGWSLIRIGPLQQL